MLKDWEAKVEEGNKDTAINPGETITVGYNLRNDGSGTMKNLRVVFSCESEGVTLSNATLTAEELLPNRSVGSGFTNSTSSSTNTTNSKALKVHIPRTYSGSAPLRIKWTAMCDACGPEGWSGFIVIPVRPASTDLSMIRYEFFDTNGNSVRSVNPGETISCDFAVKNSGDVSLGKITWTFSTESEYVTLRTARNSQYSKNSLNKNYYLRGSDQATSSSVFKALEGDGLFSFTVARDVPNGEMITINVTFTDGFSEWVFPMTVRAVNTAGRTL